MINDEMLKQVLEGAEKYQEVVVHQAADLIDQTLKFFIFDSVLSIVQTASVFLIAYIARRILDFISSEIRDRILDLKKRQEAFEAKVGENTVRSFCDGYLESINSCEDNLLWMSAVKTGVTVLLCCFFFYHSVPHFRTIGKIMVAPKLFIIEKSAELLKSKPEATNEN